MNRRQAKRAALNAERCGLCRDLNWSGLFCRSHRCISEQARATGRHLCTSGLWIGPEAAHRHHRRYRNRMGSRR